MNINKWKYRIIGWCIYRQAILCMYLGIWWYFTALLFAWKLRSRQFIQCTCGFFIFYFYFLFWVLRKRVFFPPFVLCHFLLFLFFFYYYFSLYSWIFGSWFSAIISVTLPVPDMHLFCYVREVGCNWESVRSSAWNGYIQRQYGY